MIFVTGGGTGGHYFPAVAVIESLCTAGHNCVYLGASDGIENALSKNLLCSVILTPGLKRHTLKQKLCLLPNLVKSTFILCKIFIQQRPDALVAAGGYVSLLPCLIAKIFKVPIYLMEQNRIAGRVVKTFAKHAKLVACAMPLQNNLSAKCQVLGNPVSQKMILDSKSKTDITTVKNILVMGGSASAEAIDLALMDIALAGNLEGISVYHIARPENKFKLQAVYNSMGINATVIGFCNDMAQYYLKADLVIARAGASSISELALFGIPAILVPYPFAIDNHQYFNAKFVEDSQGAILCEQGENFVHRLSNELKQLLSNNYKITSMAKNIKSLSKPLAAYEISKCISQDLK